MNMARVTALLVAAGLAGCGVGKGTIEGRVDYMDSTWDMGARPTAVVPSIVVRLIPGDEGDARRILDAWVASRAGDPESGIEPSYEGLVERIMSVDVPEGKVVESVEVDEGGKFAFAKVKAGKYLVFADYESDIGYFAWLVPVVLKGMGSRLVELNWDNKVALEVAKPVPSARVMPPGLEDVQKATAAEPPIPDTVVNVAPGTPVPGSPAPGNP